MSAADDAKAKQMVLDVLADGAIGGVNAKVGNFALASSWFGLVADAIRDGKITVLVGATHGGAGGHYISKYTVSADTEIYDVMIFNRPDLGSTQQARFQRAMLIVHESAHAAFDLLKRPMNHLESEALAYLAGALFGVAKIKSLGGNPADIKFGDSNGVQTRAWNLALHFQRPEANRGPYWWMSLMPVWNALYAGIAEHPHYASKVHKHLDNDGVGRPWKLPSAPTPGH